MAVTVKEINAAASRIAPHIHRTPIFTSKTLNDLTHAQLFFKCENFQKIGAFKIRGACNAVYLLPEEIARKGVATHSSGNHGQAVAYAAKTRGIKAYIVMPTNSTNVKRQAVEGYGAQIAFCEPSATARRETLHKIIDQTGATFLHPYDNEHIIAGQGTVGLEFAHECSDLDFIIVPVGGGGLIAGTAIAVNSLSSQTKVIGAVPELAKDAYVSFKQKRIVLSENPVSLCDGLLVPMGQITFPIILEHVNDIFTASEQAIIKAMKYIWERMKIIVEPSAAVSLAVIFENPEFFANKKVGLVLSGGNVDIKMIANLF